MHKLAKSFVYLVKKSGMNFMFLVKSLCVLETKEFSKMYWNHWFFWWKSVHFLFSFFFFSFRVWMLARTDDNKRKGHTCSITARKKGLHLGINKPCTSSVKFPITATSQLARSAAKSNMQALSCTPVNVPLQNTLRVGMNYPSFVQLTKKYWVWILYPLFTRFMTHVFALFCFLYLTPKAAIAMDRNLLKAVVLMCGSWHNSLGPKRR